MLQALRLESGSESLYERHVNPQWVRLLDILQMNVTYDRCEGAELFTADGRVILDFNSGYCVHNAGHNHPRIVDALKDELGKRSYQAQRLQHDGAQLPGFRRDRYPD